jgi:hypothetical protein
MRHEVLTPGELHPLALHHLHPDVTTILARVFWQKSRLSSFQRMGGSCSR